MNIKKIIESKEEFVLSEKASFSSKTKGRSRKEESDETRTEYMRDRDRIVHSEAFRRLKHKTQVFLSPTNDLFRTRLTHTLEVSQIARTISRALSLNEDLTEAIALGHDVGHTPFGHTGELVIREEAYPDFKHSEQSVRVLENLEKNRKGLNLTSEVLDGIRKHSKTWKDHIMPESSDDFSLTLEGEVVRISDTIAYVNHDVDDAVKSEILHEEDLPMDCQKILGKKHSERIDTLVKSVIHNSLDLDHVVMDKEVLNAVEKLRDFLHAHVYKHPVIQNEMEKAKNILYELYYFLKKNMDIVHQMLNLVNYTSDEDEKRALVDFVALMTDTEAIKLYYKHFIPKSFYLL
jgi:dGTPase